MSLFEKIINLLDSIADTFDPTHMSQKDKLARTIYRSVTMRMDDIAIRKGLCTPNHPEWTECNPEAKEVCRAIADDILSKYELSDRQ